MVERPAALDVHQAQVTACVRHMLKNGETYRPPTPNPDAPHRARERATQRLIAQLERLGHTVTVQTSTTPAIATA